ncbi:hypothetical protein [Streptomyces sp. NPDC058664]|uniref:hypothetical protein n=1 Tax=unclassified Streptomyces TaxID=2593676 RepID=UPI00364614A7
MTAESDGTLLFRNTMRITEGHLEGFREAIAKAVDFAEPHGPQLMVQTFLDEERMLAHSFQLYRDSDAVRLHWKLADPYIQEVMEHCRVEHIAHGDWRQWPEHRAAAVEEFLHAWWAHTLTDPDPAVPVHKLLALCEKASGALGPWLAAWEALDDDAADRHLAEAADHWAYGLLRDELPWDPWSDDAEATCAELTAWLVRHAPARLRPEDGHEELLHEIRLMGLTGPARWEDPHWPAHLR